MIVFRVLKCTSPYLFQKRYQSMMPGLTKDEVLNFFKPSSTDSSYIIEEAQKMVGHSSALMNLKCFQSDEFTDMTIRLSKSVGSKRQVMQTVKNILHGDSKNFQLWGLIILLLSKSVKINNSADLMKNIDENQRQLADLTNIIRSAHLIHRGLINVPFSKSSKDTESAIFSNEIVILLGDYLLATGIGIMANLRNSDVFYLISYALKDLSEGQLFGERDEQNMPLPGKPNSTGDDLNITLDAMSITANDVLRKPFKEWTARSIFNGASLLGRGCQSAMVIAKQNGETKNYAYHFGCHVGLAWQAAIELQKLTSESEEQFCLASAPVLFALKSNPDLYKFIEQAKKDVKDVDYEDLKLNILKTDAVNKTKMLCEDHVKKAIVYVDNIGQNESVDMIKKLIKNF